MLTATQRTLASEEDAYGCHSLLLHIGYYVGVDIQREPDATMSQQLTDHFGLNPLLQEQCRGRMA
jgi:hypothetical protein